MLLAHAALKSVMVKRLPARSWMAAADAVAALSAEMRVAESFILAGLKNYGDLYFLGLNE